MARRRNPEVERLEQVNTMLRQQIDRMRADPGDVPVTACGHSCVCAKAEGMATNGPCSCDERKLRRAVAYWRAVAQQRQVVIQDLREDYARGYEDAERRHELERS